MKKDVNQRQAVTVNKDGQVLRPVPLRVNPETIKENRINGKPIVYVLIGCMKYPCHIEMVTEEEFRTYMRIEWAEIKAQERENRCNIPDGTGGFIKCPECNKCRYCEKVGTWDFDNYHAVHLEAFEDDEEENEEPYPIASDDVNDGSEVMANQLAEMIEAELSKIKPKYALIFREMFNGTLKPSEIAANANLKTSTTYEDVPKVMAEAQKIFALLMK